MGRHTYYWAYRCPYTHSLAWGQGPILWNCCYRATGLEWNRRPGSSLAWFCCRWGQTWMPNCERSSLSTMQAKISPHFSVGLKTQFGPIANSFLIFDWRVTHRSNRGQSCPTMFFSSSRVIRTLLPNRVQIASVFLLLQSHILAGILLCGPKLWNYQQLWIWSSFAYRLNTFLDLQTENERLQQRLSVLRTQVDSQIMSAGQALPTLNSMYATSSLQQLAPLFALLKFLSHLQCSIF